MTKKCEHDTYRFITRDGTAWTIGMIAASTECTACQAIGVRSLGPASDVGATDFATNAVKIEIRAAEIVQDVTPLGITVVLGRRLISVGEHRGWIDHSYGETAGFIGTEHATSEELAGWLARYVGDPTEPHLPHDISTTPAEDAAAIERERLPMPAEAETEAYVDDAGVLQWPDIPPGGVKLDDGRTAVPVLDIEQTDARGGGTEYAILPNEVAR